MLLLNCNTYINYFLFANMSYKLPTDTPEFTAHKLCFLVFQQNT